MPYYFAIPNEPGVVGPLTESSSGRYSSRRLGAADLYSTDSNFVMQMDVPGITIDDINISIIDSKHLVIKGKKDRKIRILPLEEDDNDNGEGNRFMPPPPPGECGQEVC